MEFKLPKRFLFWSVWLSFEVSRLQCMGGELKGGGRHFKSTMTLSSKKTGAIRVR